MGVLGFLKIDIIAKVQILGSLAFLRSLVTEFGNRNLETTKPHS